MEDIGPIWKKLNMGRLKKLWSVTKKRQVACPWEDWPIDRFQYTFFLNCHPWQHLVNTTTSFISRDITGIGAIHGKEALIIANDATSKENVCKETIKKHVRRNKLQLENHLLAFIWLIPVESFYLSNPKFLLTGLISAGFFITRQGSLIGLSRK